MSDTSAHGGHLDYPSPTLRPGSSLARVGGALGVAGTLIGFGIFVFACAGFEAAFALSAIPLILGVVGLALTLGGGFFQEDVGLDDPQVVACYVINLAVIVGAILEFAIWRGWPIFYR